MLSMLLAGAAHGAEPCLTVALRGEPLPYGLALLMPVGVPGRPPRGPLRIREGRFCAPGLAEGQYRVDLLSEFDLTLWPAPGKSRAPQIRSCPGRADRWAPKGLSLELAAVSAAAPALHGTLRFSTTTQASAEPGSFGGSLLRAQVPRRPVRWTLINSSRARRPQLLLFCSRLRLALPLGGFFGGRPGSGKCRAARGRRRWGPQAEVELVAGAGWRRPRALPDGTPFRPVPGAAFRRMAPACSGSRPGTPRGTTLSIFTAFSPTTKGVSLDPLAPGLYSFVPQYAGSGFRWPATGTRRGGSDGARVELGDRLSPGAESAVAPPLHPRLAKAAGAATSVTELIGLPEGGFEKEAVSRALGSEGSSFMFLLEDGAWITSGRASGPQGAGAALAAPGH